MRFSTDGLARIPDEAADALQGVTVEAGDVLLNITGQSVARCCIVPSGVLPARVNQHVAIIRPDPKLLDSRFLQYALITSKPQLLSLASAGATREALTKAMLSGFHIYAPAVEEQHRLSTVLGSFDDKIVHNQLLTHTYEKIAATLFNAKFVDFLGYRTVTKESTGSVPRGWKVITLGDIASVGRKSLDPQANPDQALEHFSFPAFDAGRTPEITVGAELKSAKLIINSQCVLVSKLNPERPRVWWPLPSGQGLPVCSPEFVVLEPKDVPHAFLYGAARFHPHVQKHIVAHATGTTGSRQRVRPEEVLSARLAMPPTEVLERESRPMASFFAAAEHLRREAQTLRCIRDQLLPKLMKGAWDDGSALPSEDGA